MDITIETGDVLFYDAAVVHIAAVFGRSIVPAVGLGQVQHESYILVRDVLLAHLPFEEVREHGLRFVERHIHTQLRGVVAVAVPETDILHLYAVVTHNSLVQVIEEFAVFPETNGVGSCGSRKLTKAKVLDGTLHGGHHFKNVCVVEHRPIVEQTLLAGGQLVIAPYRIAISILPVCCSKEVIKCSIGCRKEGFTTGL